MINGSTLTIGQSFVLKWNFATSKGCFLRPITVFSMGGNWLLIIGFSAPTPCSFTIFLSRMDAESAPFFSISINSCAPLVSKKWNRIVQAKLCHMYLFTYLPINPRYNMILYIKFIVFNTSIIPQPLQRIVLTFWLGQKQFDVKWHIPNMWFNKQYVVTFWVNWHNIVFTWRRADCLGMTFFARRTKKFF